MTASADALDGQPGHQDALTPAELALVAGALAARSAASAGGDAEPQGPPAGGAGEPRDHAAVGRSQTRTLLGRFRPARPATPTAPVAMTAAPAPVMSAPPIAPPAPSAAAGEPVQAVVAGPEAPPVPVAPPARQAPSTAAATPPSAASREDVVPQPTWSIVAPDAGPSAIPGTAPGTPGRGWPAPAAAGTAASLSPSDPLAAPAPRPVPARPERPGSQRPPAGAVSQWAARLANARPETGVWAESSRGVVGAGGADAPAGIQACVSCGLPLSATARFCRRCGSRQG